MRDLHCNTHNNNVLNRLTLSYIKNVKVLSISRHRSMEFILRLGISHKDSPNYLLYGNTNSLHCINKL